MIFIHENTLKFEIFLHGSFSYCPQLCNYTCTNILLKTLFQYNSEHSLCYFGDNLSVPPRDNYTYSWPTSCLQSAAWTFNTLRRNDVNEVGHHWFMWWRVAFAAPSHHTNQCRLIVDWNPGKTFNKRIFSLIKMHLKMSPAKWPPSCSRLNVFTRLIFYVAMRYQRCKWPGTPSFMQVPDTINASSCHLT